MDEKGVLPANGAHPADEKGALPSNNVHPAWDLAGRLIRWLFALIVLICFYGDI